MRHNTTDYKNKILFIVGGHSTALEIREIFEQFYPDDYDAIYNVIGVGESCPLHNVIFDSDIKDYLERYSAIYFCIGMSSIKLKNQFRLLFQKNNGIEVNCIHPTSIVSASARIGKGIYLAPYSVISSNAVIDDGTFVNIHASIGHDCHIGKDCCINPGARISGNVTIGDRTLIGANSCVYQGITVGKDCFIDAMTYIERDIDNAMMCTNRMGSFRVYKNNVMR